MNINEILFVLIIKNLKHDYLNLCPCKLKEKKGLDIIVSEISIFNRDFL